MNKKRFYFFFSFILFLILIISNLYAEYFHIEKYFVKVNINNDSSVTFKEKIFVKFHSHRHGIYRYIPLKWGKYNFKIKIIDVLSSDDGVHFQKENYKKGWHKNYLYLRIGEKNKTYIGFRAYKLLYKIQNAILHWKNNSYFYWNVIGHGWDVPIYNANVYINFPSKPTKYSIWIGRSGSTTQLKNFIITNSNLKIENISLKPKEGITVKLIFPKGLIKLIPKKIQIWWYFLNHLAFIIPIFIFFVMLIVWFIIGRDKRTGTVVVEYYPPEGYKPAEVGVLIDDKCDNKDFVATIIDLAINGYIKIIQKEKKILFFKYKIYELERTDKLAEGLKTFERLLLYNIFKGKKRISIKDKEIKKRMYEAFKNMRKQLYEELSEKRLYETNPGVIKKVFYIIAVILIWITIILNYFFQFNPSIISGIIISGGIIALFGFLMPKKTTKGSEIYKKILGFKEFIKKVEKERLEKLLKNNPDLFNKVLPYAIALGVERHLIKKFENITIPITTWFVGSSHSINHFSSSGISNIINDINSFSKTLSSVSGSSSGGFSGGGGGGGGGGSW